MENDGVMFFKGAKGWEQAIVGDDDKLTYIARYREEYRHDWLPPLGQKWRLYLGGYNDTEQIVIALRKPKTHPADDRPWGNAFATGSWSQMWPLYLTYCNMLHGGSA